MIYSFVLSKCSVRIKANAVSATVNRLKSESPIPEFLITNGMFLFSAFIGFETNNKYTIKNNHGQKVYYAVEENDCCTRNCCGPSRSFELKILDHVKNEVIHVRRELACQSCFFPCCLQVRQRRIVSPSQYIQLTRLCSGVRSVLTPGSSDRYRRTNVEHLHSGIRY